jgi:hypothetical protein
LNRAFKVGRSLQRRNKLEFVLGFGGVMVIWVMVVVVGFVSFLVSTSSTFIKQRADPDRRQNGAICEYA